MRNEECPHGIYWLARCFKKTGFDLLLNHKNIFVVGYGAVTYSENPTVHGNNIQSALDTLTDVSSDHFTIENLTIFRSYIRQIGLETKNGQNEFEIEATFSQVQQLYNDPSVMNYWKERCDLAESYINEMPTDLINNDNVVYEKWTEFKKKNNFDFMKSANVVQQSTDGEIRISGFSILTQKSMEIETDARKFARVLDKEGINPLLVTYSPSY